MNQADRARRVRAARQKTALRVAAESVRVRYADGVDPTLGIRPNEFVQPGNIVVGPADADLAREHGLRVTSEWEGPLPS